MNIDTKYYNLTELFFFFFKYKSRKYVHAGAA